MLEYNASLNGCALVAQLDRVTGYEPVGQGFESLPAYQKNRYPIWDNGFSFYAEGHEQLNATVQWTVAAEGWTEANLNFRQGRKCKRVPSGVPPENQLSVL